MQNTRDSFGRIQDQLANPEFLLLGASDIGDGFLFFPDPYRDDDEWKKDGRGRVITVTYANRYEATISAHLWAPPKSAGDGPFPAVVFVAGDGEAEQFYWNFSQDLAEAGYLVLTYDPQGQGGSGGPAARYCDPDGDWKEPQEMGIREEGDCAGEIRDDPEDAMAYWSGVACLAQTGKTEFGVCALPYEPAEAKFVFGALDATKWLTSAENPWRVMIDEARIGIAGHSFGAYAALMAANGDPQNRFKAVVALDSLAAMSPKVSPRVPTLFQQAEYNEYVGARLVPPDPESLHATRASYGQFVEAGIDTMFVVLRASNHHDFDQADPVNGGFQAASRKGQRVATYYLRAWLDRYVKEDPTGAARLTAATFDDSVDGSSIGSGHWNLETRRNEPYLIGGEAVPGYLSFYYRSGYVLGTATCLDMRLGC